MNSISKPQNNTSSTNLPTSSIPFGTCTSFGIGFLAKFFGLVSIAALATPYYQMTLGINPAYLGIAMAIPRFWDAFTDPIMGRISDNTHTKWGRRRPYIVIGAWLTGLTFACIWMVPREWTEPLQLAYFVVTSIAFYTCFTIFAVPLTSLSYEMTPDYDERTRVMSFASFFTKIGELFYQWLFPLAQLAVFASLVTGVRVVGWFVGLGIFGFCGMLPGIFVKERYYQKAAKQTQIRILSSIGELLKNKAFSTLVGLTIVQYICGIFATSMDYYVLVYYVNDGDIGVGSVWKAYLSMGYAIVGFLSIPLLSRMSRKFGKRGTLNIVYALYLLGGISKWFIYYPGAKWSLLIDPLTGASLWIAIAMIVPSMIADVCDDDELNYGSRREGMFSALYSWAEKFGVSIALVVSGAMLYWIGFDEQLGGEQTRFTFTSMRAILSGGAIFCAIIAFIVLKFYPITRIKAEETRSILEQRRGEV